MDEHAAGPEPGGLAEPPLPPAPAPEALDRAEGLVRQARLARQRGDAKLAQKLLEEAAQLAPGSSLVQETLGDDLVARRATAKARDAYRLAMRLDPANMNAERKYAEAVLSLSVPTDLATAMGSGETYASGKIAMLLSVFVPGLGQIVVGKPIKGSAMLAGWLLAWLGVWFTPGGVEGILGLFGSGQRARVAEFNAGVLAPLALGAFCYLWALFDAAASAGSAPRKPVSRPVPPVDKPFDL